MKAFETRSAAGLLTLTALRGVGPVTALRLSGMFPDFAAIMEAPPAQLRAVVSPAVAELLRQPQEMARAGAEAERILDKAAKHGVRVLSLYDSTYPAALQSLADRPVVLFVKGTLPSSRSVACVGTREPSPFGVRVTAPLVEILVAQRWTIVSGLALGIDTLSHEAALNCKGITIAVMGGGLDSIYPRENVRLAERIVDNGGALISEQRFGVPSSAHGLVRRDRLQSGLSVGTIVMQTDLAGGAMHTVRFTLQQGRLLFALVPQGRHAGETMSAGNVAMTQEPGSRFAEIMRAEGDYRRLLEGRFKHQPVAIAVASRDDEAAIGPRLEAHHRELGARQAGSSEPEARQLSLL